MRLCRACDLAFCPLHEPAHAPLEAEPRHRLEEDPAAAFCSVCAGIYRPLAPECSDGCKAASSCDDHCAIAAGEARAA